MTDLKTNIFHSKKLRSALMLLALFSGSVLGGMLFAYITKPKEACAQCVALPTVSVGVAVYSCICTNYANVSFLTLNPNQEISACPGVSNITCGAAGHLVP